MIKIVQFDHWPQTVFGGDVQRKKASQIRAQDAFKLQGKF